MEAYAVKWKVVKRIEAGTTAQEYRSARWARGSKRLLINGCALAGAVLLLTGTATVLHAQAYPDKAVRLVLPFPPGGGVDILGRTIAPKLAERIGQPVVPENRPGAGGNVGTEFVAKARADGYTLVLTSSTLAISPSLYKKLNYAPIEDFTPVALVAQIPIVALVRPSLGINTLKEFVVYARANPGKAKFGSSGAGSTTQLANELFKSVAKLDLLHVPYKGTSQAMVALMGGEVDMLMSGLATAVPQIQASKVKALAVLSEQRVASLPNVPTAKEAGIENCEVTTWFGILAPAGTPRPIVNRLSAELTKIVAMRDTAEKMQNAGVEPMSSSPEQFAEFLKVDTARWAKVIREANIPTLD